MKKINFKNQYKRFLFLIGILSTIVVHSQANWTPISPYGAGIMKLHASSFAINNKMYIALGTNGTNGLMPSTRDIWQYAPDTDTWTEKSVFPGSARTSTTSFVLDNKGYIALGGDSTGLLKELWQYDPITDVWTQKTDFPGTARARSVSFTINEKAYVGAGLDEFNKFPKDFWEYDATTDSWTQIADFPGDGRAGAAGFALEGKGYIGTGSNLYLNDFWQYDPVLDVWTQKANFGGAGRRTAVGFSVNGKGYIGTGINGSGYQKDMWAYEVATDSWTQAKDVPIEISDATATVIGEEAYVGLGASTGTGLTMWKLPVSLPITAPEWATFFGGTGSENLMGVKEASNGDVFITGNTNSNTFPVTAIIPPNTYGTVGGGDSFIARLKGDGTTVLWWSIIGGPAFDIACRLTVDADDNVYITGSTASSFGITNPAPKAPYAGGEDAFVVKFNGEDGEILWHTYVGATGNDSGEGIEVDVALNQVIVSGTTTSGTLPAQNVNFGHSGGEDIYCAKLEAATGVLKWTSQIGGIYNDHGWGAAISCDGDAYVTGMKVGGVVATAPSNGYGSLNGGGDLMCAKFSKDEGDVVWYTAVGNQGTEIGWEVDVNSRDEVVISGHSSGNTSVYPFPWNTTVGSDAMLVSCKGNDGTLLYNHLYGGTQGDNAYGLAIDINDNIYLAGLTGSTDVLTTNTAIRNPAYRDSHTGGLDVFVAKFLDANGTLPILDWQTYYSTSGEASGTEIANSVAVTSDGFVYVGGYTTSTNFEVQNSAIQTTHAGGGRDGFVVKLKAEPDAQQSLYNISGRVVTEDGKGIAGVTVNLTDGTSSKQVITKKNGVYVFRNLVTANYTVTPAKEGVLSNGVDIADALILFELVSSNIFSPKHIPPIKDTPYKRIAADVDLSRKIDGTDATTLLNATNLYDTLVKKWLFVPKSFLFKEAKNPFSDPFPETRSYTLLNKNEINQDFIGIKVGDLNNSVDTD